MFMESIDEMWSLVELDIDFFKCSRIVFCVEIW